jgi:hypothetical protein
MNATPLSRFARGGDRHGGFLAILPRIVVHANIRFRRLRPDLREEAIAEAVAAAFVAYNRLAQKRQLHRAYPSSLADFAVRHVHEHRHVGGHQNSRDVLSRLARRRHGFTVRRLNGHDYYGCKPLIAEHGRFSPADAAAFNVDFRDWLNRFNHRHRRIIKTLAGGEGTFAVADRFGITPSRVSGLRREYEQSWQQFQGEALAA